MPETYVYNPGLYYSRAQYALRGLQADERAAITQVLKSSPFRITKDIPEDVMVNLRVRGEPVRYFEGAFSAIRHRYTNYEDVMEEVRCIIVSKRRLPRNAPAVQGSAKDVLHNFFRARMEEYLQKRNIVLVL